MQLRDLGRCVLAGRAVCRDHVLYNSVDFHNVSTHYLSIVVLNLGNIIRPPWFANRKRFPSEIRNNEERLRENLVLPHLVVNNPGHIITLNESYDFTLFRNLCIEYNLIGVQCFSNKTIHPSPPLSIFVKSSQGMVEVLHHWDASKTTGAKTDGWLLHAVIARCIFGPRSHNVDEYIPERGQKTDTPVKILPKVLSQQKTDIVRTELKMSSLKNRIWTIPKTPMIILHKATIFRHQAFLTSM